MFCESPEKLCVTVIKEQRRSYQLEYLQFKSKY